MSLLPSSTSLLYAVEHGRYPLKPSSSALEIETTSLSTCKPLSFAASDHLMSNRRWLDLLNATETQLESLTKACAPATFGADNKDVMDLSYRKAGKMDVTDFMARRP